MKSNNTVIRNRCAAALEEHFEIELPKECIVEMNGVRTYDVHLHTVTIEVNARGGSQVDFSGLDQLTDMRDFMLIAVCCGKWSNVSQSPVCVSIKNGDRPLPTYETHVRSTTHGTHKVESYHAVMMPLANELESKEVWFKPVRIEGLERLYEYLPGIEYSKCKTGVDVVQSLTTGTESMKLPCEDRDKCPLGYYLRMTLKNHHCPCPATMDKSGTFLTVDKDEGNALLKKMQDATCDPRPLTSWSKLKFKIDCADENFSFSAKILIFYTPINKRL